MLTRKEEGKACLEIMFAASIEVDFAAQMTVLPNAEVMPAGSFLAPRASMARWR
jgi:hypothetical protein